MSTQSPTTVPLYQGTAYAFESSDHAASVFDLQTPGYIYTRLNNPTADNSPNDSVSQPTV